MVKTKNNFQQENDNLIIRCKRLPLIINILKKVKVKNNNLIIKSFCFVKIFGENKYNLNKIKLDINDKIFDVKFKFKKGIKFIKGYKFNFMKVAIPLDSILNMDVQNKIKVLYKDFNHGRILYNVFDLKKGKNRNSHVFKYNNRSIFLRQTAKNTMYITVREITPYDSFKGNLKLTLGWLLSKFMIFKNNYILLFEKESSRYEESASVLYEKLIDMKYKNIFYIINKDNTKLKEIDKKYKKNFIYKNSLKHIMYFFKCKKFISTESLGHAMQLRVANKLVRDKLEDNKIMYVFLQHGVMYMISLNSDLRTGFRKLDYKLHKIVTSSERELKHFTDLGGFEREDLYVCGLPKFDKATKNKNADKIVIMPTWRRWEVNQASSNYEKTKYFKMIKRIINGIPKDLREKVIMLPHPLMLNAIKNNDKFSNYIPQGDFTYDEILKDCSLLITDYSSISYDAFYRGANIIFYWEEKEECLEKYGSGTKLMLNEKNAFGPVVYNKKELSKILKDFYNNKQINKYVKRYRKIVEFYDNKNTERLIKMLKKDNVI